MAQNTSKQCAFSSVLELDQCFMMSCKLSYSKIVKCKEIVKKLCDKYIPPKNIISEWKLSKLLFDKVLVLFPFQNKIPFWNIRNSPKMKIWGMGETVVIHCLYVLIAMNSSVQVCQSPLYLWIYTSSALMENTSIKLYVHQSPSIRGGKNKHNSSILNMYLLIFTAPNYTIPYIWR